MKKSERKLNKMYGIKFLKDIIAGDLEEFESNFKTRHTTNAIKWQINKLHRDLFLLRAAEKQVPMPVKIHSELLYFRRSDNSRLGVCFKNHFCQSCNKKILKFDGDEIKYCPHCGQKLWWPKN